MRNKLAKKNNREQHSNGQEYEELSGHVEYLESKCNIQEEEIRYVHDFISWMHLETMYADFRKNAYEFQPKDGPFILHSG